MDSVNYSLVEHAHLTEMQENLRRKLQEAQTKDHGQRDSLRATILALVVGENYESAQVELAGYVAAKTAYPIFQERVHRHVQHCCDLVQAIQTKRNFPGLASLSLSKQQEIHEKVLEHFDELKQTIKHIEKVERDHRLSDVRSTVWVLQALCYAVLAVMLAAFFVDLESGLFSSAITVIDNFIDIISTWIVTLLF